MSISRLYVSGLWIIPGNAKRSRQHYLDLLPTTFKALRGEHLVFFCESEDIKTVVLSLAQRYKVSLTIKHLPIQQHPDYALTRQMTENIRPENFKIWADAFKGSGTHEKALNQQRFLKNSRHDIYSTVVVCNLGKTSLVNEIALENKYEEYFWIDASASRLGISGKMDFRRWRLKPGAINHRKSGMKLFGNRQTAGGLVLGGEPQVWHKLHGIYQSLLKTYISTRCPHPATDEVLMTLIAAQHPELFHCKNPTRTWLHKVIGKIIWNLRLTSFINRALN